MSLLNHITLLLKLGIMSERPRARDVGITVGELSPGTTNSICDVDEVLVGHYTIIKGKGKLIPGKGPIRTGVTVILPHKGNLFKEKVRAACYVINGFGKPIGLIQLEELGTLETPIALTNTLNVGIVADAIIEYMLELNEDIGITTGTVNPVVLECNDGYLNDIRGRHVKSLHVFEAIKRAKPNVEEGCVGAGTGMRSFGWKSGIGTSSRKLPNKLGGYVIGALVLSNFGKMTDLRIMGAPVGKELAKMYRSMEHGGKSEGSIVVIIATNAPLNSRQLKRLAKRACHGIARVGGYSYHGSGDFVIAFSTSNRVKHYCSETTFKEEILCEELLSLFFKAVIEATEEAILNSLFKSITMDGRDYHVVHAIPVDEVLGIIRKYRLLN